MQTSGFWLCGVTVENSVTVEEKPLLGPDLTSADDCYLLLKSDVFVATFLIAGSLIDVWLKSDLDVQVWNEANKIF